MEILFCSKCKNMVFPTRQDDNLLFKCKCGNTELLESEISIKETIQKKSKVLEEDYDFKNKIASREINRRYLLELRKRKLIKPFKHQKALILTHIEGYDIKQILLPLGYQKKNIYIIEREKKIYEEIKNRVFFDDMHVIHKDLLKYHSKIKFDLIYLDFKGNISHPLLEIIMGLMIQNSHSGTVFYINLQMARETKDVTETFKGLEASLIGKYVKLLKKKQKGIDLLKLTKKMVKSSLQDILFKQHLLGIGYMSDIKLDINNNEISINIDNPAEELIDGFFEDLEKKYISKEIGYIKKLQEANNDHLLRISLLQIFLKGVLDLYLREYHSLKEFYDKKTYRIGVRHNIFTPLKKLTERERNLLGMMRYLSGSLIMLHYHHYIYRNKSHTPFLSILFLLKEEKQIFDHNGFTDFRNIFLKALPMLYLKSKNQIKQKSLTLALDTYEAFQFISDIQANRLPLSEIEKKRKTFRKEADEKLRKRLIRIRNVFNDFKASEMIKIEGTEIYVRMFNSNLTKITLHIDFSKELDFVIQKKGKVEASFHLLSFYLMLTILERIEQKYIDNIILLKEADLINIPEDINVKAYLDDNHSFDFESEIILKQLSGFKEWLKECMFFLDERSEIIDKEMENIEDFDKGKELLEECLYVRMSCQDFLNKKELKKIQLEKKQKENEEEMVEINRLNDTELTTLIKEFVRNNMELKSSEIAQMINNYILNNNGYDPEVSEYQIRAYKYWERVGSNT